MEPRISLLTLGVRNLEESVRFYKALGLPTEGPTGDIAFFQLNGTWLSLYPRTLLAEDAKVQEDGQGFSGFTMAHNVASKERVDELMKLAEEAGAVISDPAHDRDWGGYSGYFADPDGFLWEIAWNADFPLNEQ